MNDREKVIKGLECCISDAILEQECPYFREKHCDDVLKADALAILREQEAVEPREQEETRTWTVCGTCSQH